MKKDFLHITDFSSDEIMETLDMSREVKSKLKNRENYKPFKDQTLAMVFEKPSARTRVSFETGFFQLGGHALYLGPHDIEIGKREAVKDIARVLSGYNDMIMARLFDHAHMLELSQYTTAPVINGLTDLNHPCQVMADIFTILEHRGNLDDLKIVYMGDGNNVVYSWLELAERLPFHFVCACPEAYGPDEKALFSAQTKGLSTVEVIHAPKTAVEGADVIYTDVWASMGQKNEMEARKKHFLPFQVNSDLLAATGTNDTLVMHCLPAERGNEITDAVIESKNAVVFDEAENRMHVQNAIMIKLQNLSDSA